MTLCCLELGKRKHPKLHSNVEFSALGSSGKQGFALLMDNRIASLKLVGHGLYDFHAHAEFHQLHECELVPQSVGVEQSLDTISSKLHTRPPDYQDMPRSSEPILVRRCESTRPSSCPLPSLRQTGNSPFSLERKTYRSGILHTPQKCCRAASPNIGNDVAHSYWIASMIASSLARVASWYLAEMQCSARGCGRRSVHSEPGETCSRK